ncbi:MAG: DUF438 domain-containing protein [Spirochaetes bacterium]|nr:DUF438 domain-containing protein [Spirochaetota bacterium]
MGKTSPAENPVKEGLKALLKRIKGGTSPEELDKARAEFKGLLSKATPLLIAQAEQELIAEGFTQQDLVSACDVHLELFRSTIEQNEISVPDGHPIARFQEDHRIILALMDELRTRASELNKKGSFKNAARELERLTELIEKLLEAENHNVRQENTLFPLLEKHGLEQPPAIMWMEHTEMKEQKKKLKKLLEQREEMDFHTFADLMVQNSILLQEQFANHTLKEKNILYQAALEVLTDEDWKDIKEECDALGYFKV